MWAQPSTQVRHPSQRPQDKVLSGQLRFGTDSEDLVLLESRVGPPATSGLSEKPQGTEQQNCPSVLVRTSSYDVNPASPGESEEGRLCGCGIRAKPAGEISRFLTQMMGATVLGVTTLKPTAQLCECGQSLGWARCSETSSPAMRWQSPGDALVNWTFENQD